jgi:phage gp36-like protein
MSYITLAELADRPGAHELAQVATPLRYVQVDADLLDALLRGEDVSQWEQAQIDIGLETLEVILSASTDAAAIIDGYLRRRGYPLPLPGRFSIITAWARAITRYLLHKDRSSTESSDPIVRDYRDALKFLQQVADGSFSLGLDDTVAPSGSGSPQVAAPPRVFGPGSLDGFL